MAIYKPTDCSPFNGTFDLSSDLPIVFECKVDTSNSPVTGYSIEIYNSNNEIIFPGADRTPGPIKSNITYLTDLKEYVKDKFPSLVSNIRNVNSGLNGTVLEIPAIVNRSDTDNTTTVGRNQIGIIGGETNILVDGQTYTWKITLYQEVKMGNNVSTTTDDSTFPPNDEKYYDMTVTSGTVIGSNEKRIQTALIDSDNKVVDNLVLIYKFVQPIKINDFSYDPSDPVTNWTGTVPTTFTMTRSLITGYDSTYGYVYPSTAEGNAFTDGQIVPENASGFQIFKNGNNPSNLGATDMVDFIYDSGEFEGEMTWKTSAANPEQSYWEQVYTVDSDPGGVFYPLTGDGYSTFALTGSERIIFNNIQDSGVLRNEIYYGSPYNGIFEPHFSSKKIDGETSTYQVTVIWNRTADAANWGTLSNKIIYCRRDGKNYEINTATQAGEINKTPFKFVEEKPVRIFNTAEVTTDNAIRGDDPESNPHIFHTRKAISSILSVTNNNGVDVTKDCAFEVGNNYIIYMPSSSISSDLTISVKYIPFNIQDYTGIIFYNKQATSDLDTGIVYIRPSININKNMIFKEVTTNPKPTWFNINYFNKDYNYITYTGNQEFSPEIDETRYQIKSFYKDSDYNPFSIYKNPEITSTISGNIINSDGVTNAITTRNFTVTSTYSQNSYIQWKSYQWILYDSAKRTVLEKTDEQYNGEITTTFYGLDPQKYYILSLILQTNTGKIIEIDYVIYSNFTETAEQRDLVDAEFDCDTLSMKASLKLLDVVLAPDADNYLPGTTSTTENTVGTAYYYNSKSNFYKKDNQTIASVDSGVLTITGQNSLDFSKSFDQYDLIRAKQGDIQTNADEIVVEGSFNFSEDYNGDIFSLSREEGGTGIVQISIPKAIKLIDSDGFVALSDDINKIKTGTNSYLRIIDQNGNISREWQNSSEFHNTSIWKKGGVAPTGDRINVANFKYAEVKNADGTYNKDTYLNIAGPYNSYDTTESLKDPTNPKEQLFHFVSSDNKDISGMCSNGPFYINQPDRLIWLDYEPWKIQMEVVQDTDKSGIPVVDKQSVCAETPLLWNDNAIWKDGIYVTKGLEKTLIGQVSVNGTVVESDYLEKSGVEYSSSGLTKQIQVAQNITERKSIDNYEFAFKVFINTNNFSVDQLRSRCYVKDVSVSPIIYNITNKLINVTADNSNPTTIKENRIATLIYLANTGYIMPSSISSIKIKNCTVDSYIPNQGALTIKNPTGDVEIEITGERITYEIRENLINVTAVGTHPTVIEYGQTLELKYIANNGYILPDVVSVTGADSVWNQSTGTLTIKNPKNSVSIAIDAVLPKLSAPQEVTVNGNILSFNSVENAEKYKIFADTILIGETAGISV